MSERRKSLNNEAKTIRHIGLGDTTVRERLATTRLEHRNDIGNIWREQRRLTRERWKLESEGPTFSEEFIAKSKKLISKFKVASFSAFERVKKSSKKQKTYALIAMCLLSGLLLVTTRTSTGSKESTTASLGASTSTSNGSLQDDGRTEEKPDFEIVYPAEKSNLNAVTRRAPSGDLIHTFKDEVDDVPIEVTEQEMPIAFEGNQAEKLKELATNFQASSVIQIDSLMVYHGLNEKTGVQSLFFIKEDVLFSIRAERKVVDDSWTGYILSLQ